MRNLVIIIVIAVAGAAVDMALGLHGGVAILLGGLAVYFLPSLVASSTHKRNSGAIFLLNLLLGWTVLGWIGALIWACLHESPLPATAR